MQDMDPNPDTLATIDEMRQFHRTAGPQSLLAFQYALHALARPIHWANQAWLDDRDSEWTEDRHEGCESCTCRIESVGQCANPKCARWIASVQETAPAYCSKKCRQNVNRRAWVQSEGGQASAARAAQDKAVLQAVREHPEGASGPVLLASLVPQGLTRRDIYDSINRLCIRRAVRGDRQPDLWVALDQRRREV